MSDSCQWEELRSTFQHDNDPKHTAHLTTVVGEKKLNVLAWPSQSPDLNPITNLWNDLKTAFYKWSPSNLTELELFCKEEWGNIAKYRCA